MESCDCSGDATRYDCDSESTTTTTRHAGPRQRSRARTAFAPGFSRWFLRRLCSLSGMRAICMNKVGTMGRKGGRKEQGRMVPALNFPARERGYKIERRQSLPPSLPPSPPPFASLLLSGSFKPKCTFSLPPPITCSAFTTIERAAQILSGRVRLSVRPSERARP